MDSTDIKSVTCAEVAEKRARLGYYAASSGNFLQTFADKPSVSSSWFKTLRVRLIVCPQTSLITNTRCVTTQKYAVPITRNKLRELSFRFAVPQNRRTV